VSDPLLRRLRHLVFAGRRGALDVRARTITDEMGAAVARELAGFARTRGIRDDDILPRMEWDAFPRVAMAAGLKAQEQGVARLTRSAGELQREAERVMRESREAVRLLMREGLIPMPPGP
jgi:malate dehydrogenase (oxaloacetate-decarboxylating)